MSLSTRVALAGACALALPGASFADPTGAQDQEARIAELEAQVARLRGDNWLTEERANEVRALVHDVLADADTRASLLQSGMTAGYDNGFMIGSSDGAFSLKINGQTQVRYVWNIQDDLAGSDSNQAGFEIARAKLAFSGHVYDSTWKYNIRGGFVNGTGTFTLDNAYIDKDMGDGWTLRLGQFKLPVLREELVESYYQLAVDRSLVNETLNQGYSQGVALMRTYDCFRWAAAFSDGLRSQNTTFVTDMIEYAFTFRAEAMLSGNWGQFEDFAGWRGGEFGLLLGGAIHYEEGESGTLATETELTLITVDVTAEWDGASLFAALMYQDTDPSANNENPWGFVVQGGFFLSDDWELFGRFEYGDEDNTAANIDDLTIITVGVNKYFAKHGMKWTTDVGFALDPVTAFWGAAGGPIGWRTDSAGPPAQEDQLVLRSQLQMTF